MKSICLILCFCFLLLFASCDKKSESNIKLSDKMIAQETKERLITRQQAVDLLDEVSYEKLGLPVPLKNYRIIYDEKYTTISGKQCYGINAFVEQNGVMQNMGMFFVATDGSAMYRIDPKTREYIAILK